MRSSAFRLFSQALLLLPARATLAVAPPRSNFKAFNPAAVAAVRGVPVCCSVTTWQQGGPRWGFKARARLRKLALPCRPALKLARITSAVALGALAPFGTAFAATSTIGVVPFPAMMFYRLKQLVLARSATFLSLFFLLTITTGAYAYRKARRPAARACALQDTQAGRSPGLGRNGG